MLVPAIVVAAIVVSAIIVSAAIVVPAIIVAPVAAAIVATVIVVVVFAPHLCNLPNGNAFASRFVNGPARASAQSDENAAAVAMRVIDGTPAGAARSVGHSDVVAEIAIGTETSAVEPGLVKEFASLHVKADGDEARFTERVA